jgi:hypothetical protein
MSKLTPAQVQSFLNEAAAAFPHDECQTCECFLGYVARLRADTDADGKTLAAAYQVEKARIHSCLGCDPCPPGDLYASYTRKNSLITL